MSVEDNKFRRMQLVERARGNLRCNRGMSCTEEDSATRGLDCVEFVEQTVEFILQLTVAGIGRLFQI